jgi:phosphoserine aminotransferase
MHKASQDGLILGNGYGEYKHNTFRIANFPAHTLEEIKKLQEWLVR